MKMIIRITRVKKAPRLYTLNNLESWRNPIFMLCSCWQLGLVGSLKTRRGDGKEIYRSMFNEQEGFTNIFEV